MEILKPKLIRARLGRGWVIKAEWPFHLLKPRPTKGLCQSFFCAPQCMSMNAWMWGVLPEKWWDGGARVFLVR